MGRLRQGGGQGEKEIGRLKGEVEEGRARNEVLQRELRVK